MFGQAARSSAAAASTKTEKLSGALTPKENVIARAKSVSKPQLAQATGRRQMPRRSARPKANSAMVAKTASPGARMAGRKLFTFAV